MTSNQHSIQMQLSEKQKKKNSLVFLPFMEISSNFKYFWKKKRIVITNVFPKLLTVKTWLHDSFESDISEPYSTVNMLMGGKHLSKLHETTFIILFDHSEQKSFDKYLRYWNLKSLGSLLTHWLPVTSILFRIVRVFSSLLKCNYLKNEKNFLKFLFRFWNLPEILIIFQKRMIVRANVFPTLQTVKTWLDHSLKSAVSERLQ